MKRIVILATLDTKKDQVCLLKRYIEESGCEAIVLDCSLRSEETQQKDLLREEMLKRSGIDAGTIEKSSKHEALELMSSAAKKQLISMYQAKEVDGAIGIGGVQGTLISTSAMKELPVGIPKLVFSTIANGNTTFGPLVGTSDMTIMHSVVDVAGTNHIIQKLLRNAAAAVCGMANSSHTDVTKGKAIGITMAGVTTTCVSQIKEHLEEMGYDIIIFHCNGVGAISMEKLAAAGELCAILDITPHDIMDYLCNGLMPATNQRYRDVAKCNIPVIIAPGCADIILFNGIENIPDAFRGRKVVEHNRIHTHVKANYDEMHALGEFIIERLHGAVGPVSVLVPQRGFSQKNYLGGPLYEPESDQGFIDAFTDLDTGKIKVRLIDAHINDEAFSIGCVNELLNMLQTMPPDNGCMRQVIG